MSSCQAVLARGREAVGVLLWLRLDQEEGADCTAMLRGWSAGGGTTCLHMCGQCCWKRRGPGASCSVFDLCPWGAVA